MEFFKSDSVCEEDEGARNQDHLDDRWYDADNAISHEENVAVKYQKTFNFSCDEHCGIDNRYYDLYEEDHAPGDGHAKIQLWAILKVVH